MDFDNILPLIGGYGRYQILMYCALLIPANFPLSYVTLNFAFISATPIHWCRIPDLEEYELPMEITKNISIPWEEKDGILQHSSCKMYDLNYTEFIQNLMLDDNVTNVNDTERTDHLTFEGVKYPNASWPQTSCKYGWNYDRSLYYRTLVSDMDVVCERSWMTSVANSMLYVGTFISQLSFGYVADKWGRRTAFFIMLTITVVFQIASCFPPNYPAYIVYRGILGFGTSSFYLIPFVMAMELIIPEKRAPNGMICGAIYSVALISMSGIAYLFKDWFYISLASSVPFVLLFSYWWFLPESPRWLMSQNRIDEAEIIIQKIAKINNKEIGKDFLKTYIFQQEKQNLNKEEEPKIKSLFTELFKHPNMRMYLIIISFDWVVISVVYSGLLFQTMNMGLNDYLVNAVNSFAEIPGILLTMYGMNKIGRRWSLILSMGIGGIACLCVLFLPPDYLWTSAALAIIGKSGISGAYCHVYVYACELFPTSLRSSALSIASVVAALGTVLMPYMLSLSSYARSLPVIIMGAFSVAGAIAASGLPETLNLHLPQTIEESEALGRSRNCCSFLSKSARSSYKLKHFSRQKQELPQQNGV